MKNNDRFKLRCWDKENKRFLYPLSFDLSPKGILILSFAIEGKKYLDVNDTDRYILIQCTGLKDKNGKLIYEGDLVKLPVNCNKELHGVYTTREVVWRNGFWVLSYVSSQKGQIMPRGYSAGFLHDYLDDDFNEYFLFGNNDMFCKYKQLEVIGNIHENLELLEVKDESQASKENL